MMDSLVLAARELLVTLGSVEQFTGPHYATLHRNALRFVFNVCAAFEARAPWIVAAIATAFMSYTTGEAARRLDVSELLPPACDAIDAVSDVITSIEVYQTYRAFELTALAARGATVHRSAARRGEFCGDGLAGGSSSASASLSPRLWAALNDAVAAAEILASAAGDSAGAAASVASSRAMRARIDIVMATLARFSAAAPPSEQ